MTWLKRLWCALRDHGGIDNHWRCKRCGAKVRVCPFPAPTAGVTPTRPWPRRDDRTAETSSDPVCHEADGCPTELAVLQRFWRQAQRIDAERERLEVENKELRVRLLSRRDVG